MHTLKKVLLLAAFGMFATAWIATHAHAFGNGGSDSAEYPMSGVPVSDPCSGAGVGNCPADVLFKDGF